MMTDHQPILNKLVSLEAADPTCLSLLRRLARHPQAFTTTMIALERGPGAMQLGDRSLEEPDDIGRSLCERVGQSPYLRRLFLVAPLFSGFPASVVATVAEFSDVRPDPNTVLASRDLVFMRVVETVLNIRSASMEKVLEEDVSRLANVQMHHPSMLGLLYELATSDSWNAQLSEIERLLANPRRLPDIDASLGSVADQLLEYVRTVETTERGVQTSVLLDRPRFSSMLRDVVLAFWDIRDRLPVMGSSVQEAGELSDIESSRRVAAELFRQGIFPPAVQQKLETSLALRIEAAQSLVAARTFAKLDVLSHSWPDLAALHRVSRSRLITIEDQVLPSLQRSALPEDMQKIWDRYSHDDRLTSFLRLRPYFRDIYPDDVDTYAKLSQTTAGQALPPGIEVAGTPERPDLVDMGRIELADASWTYEDVIVTFQLRPPADQEEERGTSGDGLRRYEVGLRMASTEARQTVDIDWATFERNVVKPLEEAWFFGSTHLALQARDLRRTESKWTHDRLRGLGAEVFDLVFQHSIRDSIVSALKSGKLLRFLIDLRESDPQFSIVPWEFMYAHPIQTFLGLVKQYSLVRYIKSDRLPPYSGFSAPLRILALLASPLGFAPLNVAAEEEVLHLTLSKAVADGIVDLVILKDNDATVDNLQRVLFHFHPHVFHYVGHGAYAEGVGGSGTGALIFVDSQDNAHILGATEVATLLTDSNVRIAVLNGCDTGNAIRNDAVTSVAGALVAGGVAAVVATMRQVPDDAALIFARELYRSLADGSSIEVAVVEARKSLSIYGWNWSTYALFGDSRELGSLRLMVEGSPNR